MTEIPDSIQVRQAVPSDYENVAEMQNPSRRQPSAGILTPYLLDLFDRQKWADEQSAQRLRHPVPRCRAIVARNRPRPGMTRQRRCATMGLMCRICLSPNGFRLSAWRVGVYHGRNRPADQPILPGRAIEGSGEIETGSCGVTHEFKRLCYPPPSQIGASERFC